jgi:hypothetical protein
VECTTRNFASEHSLPTVISQNYRTPVAYVSLLIHGCFLIKAVSNFLGTKAGMRVEKMNLILCTRERERVRKDSIRVEVKRKHLGESERRFISEGKNRASC